MQLALAIGLLAVTACGHGTHADEKEGSGSGSSSNVAIGSGSTSATAAPDANWRLVRMRGAYAIIAVDDHRAAIVAADGHVAARITVSNLAAFQTAEVANDVLVWADATGVRAWDLTKGAERWHAAPEPGVTHLVVGTAQIAALHPHGVDVFKLSDGTRTYHRDGPNVVDGKAREGMFVFSDASGGVEAVAESTGHQRWSAKFHEKVEAPTVELRDEHALVFDGGRVRHDDGHVSFEAGSFLELDLATGATKSSGTISDTLPGKFAAGSQTSVAYAPDGSTFVQAKPLKAPLKIFRRDPAARIVWSATGWPLQDALYQDNASPLHEDGPVDALVLKPRSVGNEVTHILVVFDAASGKVHFTQTLGAHGELLKLTHGCALVLDRDADKLTCVDEATGKPQWIRPLSGRDPQAWASKDDDDVMVVDGIPTTLSRIDATNKMLWWLELPAGVTPKKDGIGSKLIVLPRAHQLDVVDVATGKLATVKP